MDAIIHFAVYRSSFVSVMSKLLISEAMEKSSGHIPRVVWCLMPMGAQHEEMGTHSRLGGRFVDGVRALQQIVAPSEDEQLSGSLCGKVGAVQGHRPVCWDRFGLQYLAGADKCSGLVRSTIRLRSRSGQ
jgi:hypothetical protein